MCQPMNSTQPALIWFADTDVFFVSASTSCQTESQRGGSIRNAIPRSKSRGRGTLAAVILPIYCTRWASPSFPSFPYLVTFSPAGVFRLPQESGIRVSSHSRQLGQGKLTPEEWFNLGLSKQDNSLGQDDVRFEPAVAAFGCHPSA